MNDVATQASEVRSPFEIRRELVELILKDLLGPFGGDEEELQETWVSDRYVLGMLAPRNRMMSRETEDELADGGSGSVDEGSAEPTTSPAETTMPSSMGLTFTVAGTTKGVSITARWGRYERLSKRDRDETNQAEESNESANSAGSRKKPTWKRFPCGGGLILNSKKVKSPRSRQIQTLPKSKSKRAFESTTAIGSSRSS